ncbi:MAG: hypothetical protein ACUVXA_14865, partial [Candidatus Jordarchaeum sp.]|uniref:hypothetical protein n=1 Tax=Candidatus Jordarchaeum sp. TaxID=2823881 RepID=UPI004049B185
TIFRALRKLILHIGGEMQPVKMSGAVECDKIYIYAVLKRKKQQHAHQKIGAVFLLVNFFSYVIVICMSGLFPWFKYFSLISPKNCLLQYLTRSMFSRFSSP